MESTVGSVRWFSYQRAPATECIVAGALALNSVLCYQLLAAPYCSGQPHTLPPNSSTLLAYPCDGSAARRVIYMASRFPYVLWDIFHVKYEDIWAAAGVLFLFLRLVAALVAPVSLHSRVLAPLTVYGARLVNTTFHIFQGPSYKPSALGIARLFSKHAPFDVAYFLCLLGIWRVNIALELAYNFWAAASTALLWHWYRDLVSGGVSLVRQLVVRLLATLANLYLDHTIGGRSGVEGYRMGGWRAGGVGAVLRRTYGGSRGKHGSGYGASSGTAQQRRAAAKEGFEELAPAAVDAAPVVEGQGGRGSSNSSGSGSGSGRGIGDGSGDKTVVVPFDGRAVAAAVAAAESSGGSAVAAAAVGAAVPVTPPRVNPSAFGPRDAVPLSPQPPSQPQTQQHPQHQQQCEKVEAPGGIPIVGQTVPDAACAAAIRGSGVNRGLVAARAPGDTEVCVGGITDTGTNSTRGAIISGSRTSTTALPRAPLPPYRSPVQRRVIQVKIPCSHPEDLPPDFAQRLAAWVAASGHKRGWGGGGGGGAVNAASTLGGVGVSSGSGSGAAVRTLDTAVAHRSGGGDRAMAGGGGGSGGVSVGLAAGCSQGHGGQDGGGGGGVGRVRLAGVYVRRGCIELMVVVERVAVGGREEGGEGGEGWGVPRWEQDVQFGEALLKVLGLEGGGDVGAGEHEEGEAERRRVWVRWELQDGSSSSVSHPIAPPQPLPTPRPRITHIHPRVLLWKNPQPRDADVVSSSSCSSGSSYSSSSDTSSTCSSSCRGLLIAACGEPHRTLLRVRLAWPRCSRGAPSHATPPDVEVLVRTGNIHLPARVVACRRVGTWGWGRGWGKLYLEEQEGPEGKEGEKVGQQQRQEAAEGEQEGSKHRQLQHVGGNGREDDEFSDLDADFAGAEYDIEVTGHPPLPGSTLLEIRVPIHNNVITAAASATPPHFSFGTFHRLLCPLLVTNDPELAAEVDTATAAAAWRKAGSTTTDLDELLYDLGSWTAAVAATIDPATVATDGGSCSYMTDADAADVIRTAEAAAGREVCRQDGDDDDDDVAHGLVDLGQHLLAYAESVGWTATATRIRSDMRAASAAVANRGRRSVRRILTSAAGAGAAGAMAVTAPANGPVAGSTAAGGFGSSGCGGDGGGGGSGSGGCSAWVGALAAVVRLVAVAPDVAMKVGEWLDAWTAALGHTARLLESFVLLSLLGCGLRAG